MYQHTIIHIQLCSVDQSQQEPVAEGALLLGNADLSYKYHFFDGAVLPIGLGEGGGGARLCTVYRCVVTCLCIVYRCVMLCQVVCSVPVCAHVFVYSVPVCDAVSRWEVQQVEPIGFRVYPLD